MCRRATCRVCGKTTWAGCGQHVNQVMAGVPSGDRCHGHSRTEQDTAAGPARGFLSRLLGRD